MMVVPIKANSRKVKAVMVNHDSDPSLVVMEKVGVANCLGPTRGEKPPLNG